MKSKFRAQLRSRAQLIPAYVMVGRDGVTQQVCDALSQALECHELVKVRFQAFKDDSDSLSCKLAESTESELVAVTGFTAVFYKKKEQQ